MQQWLDVTANNLANSTTTGYKRDGFAFAEAMERVMASNGGDGRILGSIGNGAVPVAEFTIFDRGTVSTTGNPLDLAIDSPRGWFAVDRGGQTMYTRAGNFTLDAQRQIVDVCGNPVLDRRGNPITVPQGQIEISQTGAVSVGGRQVAEIAIYDGQMAKVGSSLYRAVGNPLLLDTRDVLVRQGALEQSNVNPVESMINLITIGRTFEISQKSITQQDELTQRLIQSLSER
jgi:flagellar basal body rod protein FlgG